MVRGSHRCQHLRHTAEVAAGQSIHVRSHSKDRSYIHPPSINTEEQVDRASARSLLERLVKPFITRVSRTPDLILQRLVYIVFGV